MILIRTQDVDERLERFADDLARWSGMEICFIADERKAPVSISGRFRKVSLTVSACEDLGLYCSKDFAWRCGDYGLYLALKAFPGHDYYWLIESDVRLAGAEPGNFFANFDGCDLDFLSSYLEKASPDWHWYRAAANRDLGVYKCFFPACRFSATALDGLLQVRRIHAGSWARRYFWPNDEAFVATTLIGGGFSTGDLNEAGGRTYDTGQFHFETVFDGANDLPDHGPTRLFHPVLFDKALDAKRKRLASKGTPVGRLERMAGRLNRKLGPAALAYLVNRRSTWAGQG